MRQLFRPLIAGIALLAAAGFLPTGRASGADLDLGSQAFEAGDYVTAFRHWKPLAEAGNASAQYNLGILYEFGLGVFESNDEAANWYARSAEKGLAEAQFEVAKRYLEGYYGPPDLIEASDWLRFAADQGHLEAAAMLQQIGGDSAQHSIRTSEPSQQALVPPPGSAACPETGSNDFKVTVTIDIPPAPVDHSRSSAELTKGTFHGAGGKILGLMVPNLSIHTRSEYGSQRLAGGDCFWVEGISATMEYRSVKIYIASEYKKGSCEYRQILLHEKRHVEIARRNLEHFKPQVRAALTSLLIPKPDQPIRIASASSAGVEMERLYQELLEPVYQKMLTSLRAAQGAIDTPEAYAKVHRRCENW